MIFWLLHRSYDYLDDHSLGFLHVFEYTTFRSIAAVLVSFFIMASLVIAAKLAHHEASWGMQFQNPAFLVAMTILTTLVALNLFGLFEFNLSGTVMGAETAHRLMTNDPVRAPGSALSACAIRRPPCGRLARSTFSTACPET